MSLGGIKLKKKSVEQTGYLLEVCLCVTHSAKGVEKMDVAALLHQTRRVRP